MGLRWWGAARRRAKGRSAWFERSAHRASQGRAPGIGEYESVAAKPDPTATPNPGPIQVETEGTRELFAGRAGGHRHS